VIFEFIQTPAMLIGAKGDRIGRGGVCAIVWSPVVTGEWGMDDPDLEEAKEAKVEIQIGDDVPLRIEIADFLVNGTPIEKSDGGEWVFVANAKEADLL
jgi:hypothetical protein